MNRLNHNGSRRATIFKKSLRTLIERGLAADAEKNSDGGASLVASTAVTENRTDVSAPDSHITGNGATDHECSYK